MIAATLTAIASLPLAPAILGYVPFRDPLPLDTYWLLLLPPLALAIGVVHKAIKTDDLSQLPRRAGFWALQVVSFMLLAAVMLWLITEIQARM